MSSTSTTTTTTTIKSTTTTTTTTSTNTTSTTTTTGNTSLRRSRSASSISTTSKRETPRKEKKGGGGGSGEKTKKTPFKTDFKEIPSTPTAPTTTTPGSSGDLTLSVIDDDVQPIAHQLEIGCCPVERVTVYSDRAETTRKFTIECDKVGPHNVIIGGFTTKINPNTIRVAGNQYATILEVSYTIVHPKEVPPSNEELLQGKTLKQQIKQLELQKSKLLREQDLLKKEETWYESFANNLIRPHRSDVVVVGKSTEVKETSTCCDNSTRKLKMLSVEEAKGLMETYTKNLKRIASEKHSLNIALKKIDKDLEMLRKELSTNSQSDPKPERREVTLEIFISQVGSISLQLSYIVMDASWLSLYDVRVDTDEETCKLIYYGVITNNTGEDWKEVDLSLSTAEPSLGGSPPAVFPIHLQFTPPERRRFFVEQSSSNSSDESSEGSASGSCSASGSGIGSGSGSGKKKKEKETSVVSASLKKKKEKKKVPSQEKQQPIKELTTQVEEGGSSATYRIRRKATVDSDNKPHKVTIMHEDLQAKFEYVCVPTRTTTAYLKATTTNSSSFRLLRGPMNVFMNNFFIATSQLNNTSPKEVFKLYLGADDGIKVDFKPIQQNESVTGGVLSKKTKTETTTHTTVITNLKKKPVKIIVFDQKPFTQQTSDIKIKIEEPRPNTPSVTNDEYNLTSWEISLSPGQETVVQFRFSVEYPFEKQIAWIEQKGVKGEMRL